MPIHIILYSMLAVRVDGRPLMYRTNEDIARRVYLALKTPSDDNPRTDPILAFHFEGKDDYIMMRCNKLPEISIKACDGGL